MSEELNLSEHEKEMIKVAEGGAPIEGEDKPRLPSEGDVPLDQMKPEDMSREQLLEFLQRGKESDEEESDEEESEESTDEEDADEEDDGEELSDAEKRLLEAEEKLREVAAYEAAGGKEDFQALIKWGGENLSEDQVGIFNQAVTEGDPEVVTFAVSALKSMQELAHIKNFGYEGDSTNPDAARYGNEAVKGYESQAEMEADMRDPRYQTDPAYRERVAMKLGITTSF